MRMHHPAEALRVAVTKKISMSMQASRTRLSGLSKELSRQWQDCQQTWRDTKSKEFDASYIQPLLDGVDNAVTAMEDLDKILKKLRHDCEL